MTEARTTNHPEIQGYCPACGGTSLFLGSGGHVTCARLGCLNPSAADQLLHGESEGALAAFLGGGRPAQVVARTLHSRGHALDDVRHMTDEQFLAVPGIGETSLAIIRAAVPTPTASANHASRLEEEIARLRAGEEPGGDPATAPTPGQWIGRWNAASVEERLRVAQQVIENEERAARCFAMAHEKRIEVTDKALVARRRLTGEAEATIARVRAESARIRATTRTWGPVADLIDAALDGDEPGPKGGALTLTFYIDSLTIDGKEVGDE